MNYVPERPVDRHVVLFLVDPRWNRDHVGVVEDCRAEYLSLVATPNWNVRKVEAQHKEDDEPKHEHCCCQQERHCEHHTQMANSPVFQ